MSKVEVIDVEEIDEAAERQKAECEFVSAAYAPNEAWVVVVPFETNNIGAAAPIVVHRRLIAAAATETCSENTSSNSSTPSNTAATAAVSFLLQLKLTRNYPVSAGLEISADVEQDDKGNMGSSSNKNGDSSSTITAIHHDPLLIKAAYNALPNLVESCRKVSESMPGEEAILAVFGRANQFLRETWPMYIIIGSSANTNHNTMLRESNALSIFPNATTTATATATASNISCPNNSMPAAVVVVVLSRNLMYSHHIIGPKKRADIQTLVAELKLTGYCKIGWPGLILVEGEEACCHAFYDQIRRWAWQYLVRRGEAREEHSFYGSTAAAVDGDSWLDSKRKFRSFLEVSDMSVVASHCRRVGLESLFMKSMKIYDNSTTTTTKPKSLNPLSDSNDADVDESLYGALIRVNHMNDGKAYRKWLRKTCNNMDVALLVKQCYPNHDFSKRPLIAVGLLGSNAGVSTVLKRWRTSRGVDVDSRGKPCFERMLTVLVEGALHDPTARLSVNVDWDDLASESQLNTTKEKLIDVIRLTEITPWIEAAALL